MVIVTLFSARTIFFTGLLLTQVAVGTPIAVGAQARTLTVGDLR